MKTDIRTLNRQDFPQLAQTADRIWRQSYMTLLGREQIDYMLEMFQSEKAFERQASEGYIYRGVFADGRLVGYTGSRREDSRIFLSKLYLDKEFHGMGVGRKMLEDVISQFPECTSLYLTVNKHNPSFEIYRHWGFEVTDAVVTDIGQGYVMGDYIMELKLK